MECKRKSGNWGAVRALNSNYCHRQMTSVTLKLDTFFRAIFAAITRPVGVLVSHHDTRFSVSLTDRSSVGRRAFFRVRKNRIGAALQYRSNGDRGFVESDGGFGL